MPRWFRRLWRDPVWSAVIATGIASAIGSLGLYVWKRVSANASVHPTAWDTFTKSVAVASDWLWRPLSVPRVLVWLALLGAAVVIARSVWRYRAPTPGAIKLPKSRTQVYIPKKVDAPPPTPIGDLTNRQEALVRMLIAVYPDGLELSRVAPQLRLGYAAAEKLAEGLEQLGLIAFARGAHNPASVFLQPAGRDLCLERGWEK
jgi:hypothetical protein